MNRYGYVPVLVIVIILLLVAVLAAYAQSPVISPNGQVTIIYPSQNGMPAMAIAPNGGVTYAYPSTPAPITVMPLPAPMPPSALSMPPLPMPGMAPMGGLP
jgi:hypothetical protein